MTRSEELHSSLMRSERTTIRVSNKQVVSCVRMSMNRIYECISLCASGRCVSLSYLRTNCRPRHLRLCALSMHARVTQAGDGPTSVNCRAECIKHSLVRVKHATTTTDGVIATVLSQHRRLNKCRCLCFVVHLTRDEGQGWHPRSHRGRSTHGMNASRQGSKRNPPPSDSMCY